MFNIILKFKLMIYFNFLPLLIGVSQNKNYVSIREHFDKHKDNYQECKKMFEKLEKDIDVVRRGYAAMYAFMLAKHHWDVFSKWHYFVVGKKLLENAILENSNNLELRFMRMVIQMNLPAVLGYNSKIEEDKAFVLKHFNSTNDEDLKSRIKNYLINNEIIKDKSIEHL